MNQPMNFREKASRTTQQSLPSLVGMLDDIGEPQPIGGVSGELA
jgi:hypothetical protein